MPSLLLAPLLAVVRPCMLLILALCASRLSAADDVVSVARTTLAHASSSVVTVHGTVTLAFTSASGQKQKQNRAIELHATCVDQSGIFAASYTELIPGERIQAMLDAQNRQMHVDALTADLTVEFADGSHKDADIVVNSRELDVAMLRLRDKVAGLTYVDLSTAVTSVQALDQVYVLGLATKSENRTPMLALGRILCSVGGAKSFYLGDLSLGGFMGCMVYSATGQAVGLEVFRPLGADAADGHGILQQSDLGVTIRPATQLADMVKVALTAKVAATPAMPAATPITLPLEPVTP